MALSFEMDTEQKQLLSQKMIQSANILQMTAAQLAEYLNEQSLENPVMDLTEKKQEEYADKELEKYQWLRSHDEQNRYLYQRLETGDDPSIDWNYNVENPESLHDYLWSQLLTRHIPAEDEEAWHFLLNSLDSRGYFTDSPEEFSRRFHLTPEHTTQMLQTLKELSPAGVGAKDLAECLCIQLNQQGKLTPGLREFIQHHLNDMAKNHLPAIARSMKLTLNTVKKYCALVRTLDPKPGSRFSDSRQAAYIIPDAVVVKFRDHFDILLNESLYPDISLNGEYVKMYQEQDDPEVKTYLLDKIHQVQWIKQCIGQRNTTLFKVIQEIVLKQKDFFLYGASGLKPLRLTDVAEALKIHESTVSRAVRGKYLQCPWGIYPLNSFFPRAASGKQETANAAPASFGDAAASVRHDMPAAASARPSRPLHTFTASEIKAALKELIEKEDKAKPFSDQILSERLSAAGYPVSRRTIAKYRAEEGIPSASGRKTY